MSAPTTRDPLVVNTQDGSCWTRRAVTREGRGLYGLEGTAKDAPELVDLAEHGLASMADALPMPVGPEPQGLTAEQRSAIASLIGDAKPASAMLLHAFGEAVRDCREHEHPKSEDFYCLNLTAWMGERAGLVLRSLLDAEAESARLRARCAELEAERHSTNEALDDAVRELRARRSETATAPYKATPETRAQMRSALTKHHTTARSGSCENCGSVPEEWCPDCAACQQGCFGGFNGNACTHSKAPWGGGS